MIILVTSAKSGMRNAEIIININIIRKERLFLQHFQMKWRQEVPNSKKVPILVQYAARFYRI